MLLPLLGTTTLPDTSGDVFQEPYSVKATNDVWPFAVWVFNDTATRIGLSGSFIMPAFTGSLAIKPFWTSTATSGNCVWDFEYRAVGGDDAESLDQAGTQESVTVTDAAPTAAHRLLLPSLALTAANFAAGDLVEFKFFRSGDDAADTMAAAALLHDLALDFTPA